MGAEENKQETNITSSRSTRRARMFIMAGAAILIAAIAIILMIALPKKSDAERLEEALSLGEKYLSELDYEQAIASYQMAIEIDPKCVDAYIGLADAYIAAGNYDEAENVLARAEQMLLGREEAGEDVSADLERIRRKLEERKELEAAKKLALAEEYLFASKYGDASKEFAELLEMVPDRLTVYFGGVDAYLHLGESEKAAALAEDGNFANILDGINKSAVEGYIALAEAFEAEGMHERAVELLERVYRETGDEVIGRKLGIVEASQVEFREDYVIEWQDAEFERLIREYLGKESGDIHYDDVKEIEEIAIWADIILPQGEQPFWSSSRDWFWLGDGREGTRTGKIHSLRDLEHFTSLKQLQVNYQEDLDISALADTDTIDCLLRLENLVLASDGLRDISVISGLSALKSISIMYNDITDISPLAMLIELERVDVIENEQLASPEALKGLRKLKSVSLSYVKKVDLEIFSDLPELRWMNLVDIEEIDYDVLRKMKLEYLEISCDDEVFSIVRQLKTLKSLRLHGWRSWNEETQSSRTLTSIEGIGDLTNLTDLALLVGNCLDISPISSLNIETLEIQLPEDCDLAPLKELSSLKTVIVPVSDFDAEDDPDRKLLERVKNLLPDVEVKGSRY